MVFPFRRLTQKEGDILMAMELKTTGVNGFVKPAELTNMETLLNAVNDELLTGKGAGSDFLGWLDLPVNYDKEEFDRIQKAAKKIQGDSDVLVVIGIGGSYLGARAAIEFCKGQMYNGVREKGIPEIYFVGNNISSSYINDVVKIIGDRDFSVNIISKSGTTTEPAIAFRVFKKMLEEKYGAEGAKGRIYATTDKARGALKNLANVEGYESFVVPDDVGGRFSVLTAVGLLPIAAKYCDVVSVNNYANTIAHVTVAGGIPDVPFLIGEFSFQVPGRGMFNYTLSPAGVTQDDRAEAFLRFWQGLLMNPNYVGAHWFCYRDQFLTGRGDGENYAHGFVDVCDTPYREMGRMSREVAEMMYRFRLNGRLEQLLKQEKK